MITETQLDHLGSCPNCGVSWSAGEIFPVLRKQHAFDKYSDDELRAKIKEWYGPPYEFSRLIGIETRGYDGVSAWQCPDCQHTWPRFIRRAN